MLSSECKVGKRLRHKELNTILEVEEIDGVKLFVEQKWGDAFDYVDEDLYYDLDYYI